MFGFSGVFFVLEYGRARDRQTDIETDRETDIHDAMRMRCSMPNKNSKKKTTGSAQMMVLTDVRA